jgi:hypothetical protein
MTSGPPSTPIESFHDIIEQNYKVVTMHSTSNHRFLKLSQPGTAMNEYYYRNMEDNDDAYVPNVDAAVKKMLSEDKVLFFSSSFGLAHDQGRDS